MMRQATYRRRNLFLLLLCLTEPWGACCRTLPLKCSPAFYTFRSLLNYSVVHELTDWVFSLSLFYCYFFLTRAILLILSEVSLAFHSFLWARHWKRRWYTHPWWVMRHSDRHDTCRSLQWDVWFPPGSDLDLALACAVVAPFVQLWKALSSSSLRVSVKPVSPLLVTAGV